MSTEEELGYRDAMRQVERYLQRRKKSLLEAPKNLSAEKEHDLSVRISEIEHTLEILESLRR
jgi:hypothetical protein